MQCCQVYIKSFRTQKILKHHEMWYMPRNKLWCNFHVSTMWILWMLNHSHFLSHSKQIGHIFGINSNNGLLFCFKCEDYIGNIDLINDAILAKYWDDVCTKTMVPSMERRDGLSGLINMGSTCFMSSILQCLIHNPYLLGTQ